MGKWRWGGGVCYRKGMVGMIIRLEGERGVVGKEIYIIEDKSESWKVGSEKS